MSKSKDLKRGSIKPRLVIEIEDFEKRMNDFKESDHKNQVAVKPLRSMKNIHELKKFTFEHVDPNTCNTDRKAKRLKKLQEEKVNLIHSIEILKMSAVSAIAEKQEEIETLKQRDLYNEGQTVEFYQQQFEREKKIREELEEERHQLYREIHEERQKYASDLEEKEQHIDSLVLQILQVRRQLDQLQQSDIVKSKRIKLLQEQNSYLSEQLQNTSIATALMEKDRRSQILPIDFDETIKINTSESVASSIPNKNSSTYIQLEQYFQSEADKTYLTQKLEEIQKTHRQELLDLRSFYEKRITGLRQIYERQLNLQTEQNEKQHSQWRSKKLSRTSSNPHVQKHDSGKKQERPDFHLNLRDMYSIQENYEKEQETARSKMTNLKQQIKMQNLSECPSFEPRMLTNEDAESQFTTKYFEVPNRFMKKNRSTDTLTMANEYEAKTINRIRQQCQQDHIKQTFPEQKQDSIFQKTCIFTAGLVSGVTITSLIGFLIKKVRSK